MASPILPLTWIFPPWSVLLRLNVPDRSQADGQRDQNAWIVSPLIGPRLPVKAQANSAFSPFSSGGRQTSPLKEATVWPASFRFRESIWVVPELEVSRAANSTRPWEVVIPRLEMSDLDFLLRLPPVEQAKAGFEVQVGVVAGVAVFGNKQLTPVHPDIGEIYSLK